MPLIEYDRVLVPCLKWKIEIENRIIDETNSYGVTLKFRIQHIRSSHVAAINDDHSLLKQFWFFFEQLLLHFTLDDQSSLCFTLILCCICCKTCCRSCGPILEGCWRICPVKSINSTQWNVGEIGSFIFLCILRWVPFCFLLTFCWEWLLCGGWTLCRTLRRVWALYRRWSFRLRWWTFCLWWILFIFQHFLLHSSFGTCGSFLNDLKYGSMHT